MAKDCWGAYLANHLMNLPMMCSKTTEKTKAIESTSTTTGSTLRPLESSVYKRIMVDDEPPAPAARVELGLSAAFCAARRRTACEFLDARAARLGCAPEAFASDCSLGVAVCGVVSVQRCEGRVTQPIKG